jgi:signal transduction histidine kinase
MKFGRLKGFSVILRSPDDIAVISRPPWWTPRRLAVVIASLIALLAAIITWNRVLQRIVERRSRALIKSQTGKIQAELRIDERTRLAVELHDSLAQNLTGISLQIAAAQTAQSMDPEASNQHMDTASRMLQSCRTELRRCIWDLRGDALEERDFAEAIRKTLQPIADSVTVAMRVDVPRSRLSDSTAHSVLRILRELASNAIRHGKARHIYVAGALETGKLQFSVRDDGCGFIPGNCPGPGYGHFGLDGIRERIKRLGGTFKVESTPGTGTYARFEIRDMSTNEKKDGLS